MNAQTQPQFPVDETVPNTTMSVEPMRSLRFISSWTPL